MDYDARREDLTVAELNIEKHLQRRALEYGCIEVKMLVRTWPDRALLWPGGVTDWVELKRPKGGKFQPGQLHRHAILRELGHTCEVLKTKREVDLFFKRRAAMLGIARLAPLPKAHRSGELSAVEYTNEYLRRS